MPVLMLPLALVGLAALPALAAIYWLRNRYRRQSVSSLLLWVDQREAREGGMRVQKVQTPWLFMLELAALALLALAAAGPRVPWAEQAAVYVVVLDDAFAMRAAAGAEPGAGDTVRDRAIEALRAELEGKRFAARFVVAGLRPQVLGEPVEQWTDAAKVLEGWRCRSPRSGLSSAVVLARELGGSEADVLVVTDRPPEPALEQARLRWWALGEPADNVAFTNAVRTATGDGGDRVMLEVANLADAPAQTTLTFDGEARRLQLTAGQSRQLWFDLPRGTGAIEIALADDALSFDNRAVLQPARTPRVTVALAIADDAMHDIWRRALRATDRSNFAASPSSADLLISDAATAPLAEPGTWVVQVRREGDAAAFTGPFLIDRSHPLTAGLSLEGVIWGAGRSGDMPGTPLIAAGDEVLLSHAPRGRGGHVVRMRWRPSLSTLEQTPTFPGLVWNLLDWRAAHLPGPAEPNVRLGMAARVTVPAGVNAVRVTDPAGREQTLAVVDEVASWEAAQPGVWQVEAAQPEGEAYAIAVNVLARETSDLRGAATGRWGNRVDERVLQERYRDMSWALLLVVLLVLVMHGYLVWRGGQGGV